MNRQGIDKQKKIPPDNLHYASCFHDCALLLNQQGANPFRVSAYRNAASTLHHLEKSAKEICEHEGVEGLMKLPGLGRSLAWSLKRLIESGHMPVLDRLKGDNSAEQLVASVADIGEVLATRVVDELGIETLPELLDAVYDGRLEKVDGFGEKRLRAVREALTARLLVNQPELEEMYPPNTMKVPVADLLELDNDYLDLVEANQLPRIAPKKNNPSGKAWLPVWHTEKKGHHYTIMFSNTTHAHDMHACDDWVIIILDDDKGHGQWTVITSRFGSLKGCRIIRGREAECRRYYRQLKEET